METKERRIVEYIRKGYRGKRIIKDGIEYAQTHKGHRIGVFVALNTEQFGWSLVHLKGEHKEPVKNILWSKGVEMAVARAKGEAEVFGLTTKIPDSIKKQFEDFKKRATKSFTEEIYEVKDSSLVVRASFDGKERCYSLGTNKSRGRINFKQTAFQNLSDAIQKALTVGEGNEIGNG